MDALRLIHLLAMAFFVGGQLVLAAAVVPAMRGREDDGTMRRVARRFGIGSVIAVAVLAATGAAMASDADRWGDGNLHAKLALLALVLALTALHAKIPQRHLLSAAIGIGSLAIVGLGVALAH